MMGPQAHHPNFNPGTIVAIDARYKFEHEKAGQLGTVIDNFVDINIISSKRIEKVLVMWSDGETEWLFLYQVTPVKKA